MRSRAFDDALLWPVFEVLQDWEIPVFLMTTEAAWAAANRLIEKLDDDTIAKAQRCSRAWIRWVSGA